MKKLRELFGVDLRSLALFRVALALTILFDLAFRAQSLRSLYTDFGVLPRVDMLSMHGKENPYSIYLITGSTAGVACLFAIQALFALALLIGYRTRLATFLSWVMLVSLQSRNPQVSQGGDLLFHLLLWWGLFVPLGARWSVDSATDALPPEPVELPLSSPASAGVRSNQLYFSAGSFALLMQMAIMYWFAAGLKLNEVWLRGYAVGRALQIDMYVTPLGIWLRQWTALLPYLTWGTLAMESLGPFLAFIPWATGRFRMAAIILFALWHLGMGTFLDIGIFRMVAIVGWLAFLPPCFWEWFLPRGLHTPARNALCIYYDGDCAFCKRTVLILRTFLLLPRTPLLPAQSDPAIEAAMRQENSWVVIDHLGRRHYKFDAMICVISMSPLAWFLAPLLDNPWPRALGRRCYEGVANHRPRADRLTRWLTPRPPRLRPSWAGSILALGVFFYAVAWNIRAINTTAYEKYLPNSTNWIAWTLHCDQYWCMFAPYPLTVDGWFVVDARLANDQRVDPWRNAPVAYDMKPVNVAATYVDGRWRKYLEMLALGAYGDRQRTDFAAWLCRDWNYKHPPDQRITQLTIYFMRSFINPDGKTPTQRVMLTYYQCDEDETR